MSKAQTNLNHWDLWYINLAKNMAQGSKDPSTGVGCVIADSRHRFRSTGFNGFPAGVKDTADRLNDRETKLKLTQSPGYVGATDSRLIFHVGFIMTLLVPLSHRQKPR